MAELSHKSESVLGLKGKPLEWWRNHKHSYPNLSRMAQKYLGVVATSVPSERLFSIAGNVVTSKRSAIEPENVEKLVFCMITFQQLVFHISELSDINHLLLKYLSF